MNQPHHQNRYQAGDNLVAPDPPPYPMEWDFDQRVTAYWSAVTRGFPRHTSGWYGLLSQAHNKHDHIEGLLAQQSMDYEQ